MANNRVQVKSTFVKALWKDAVKRWHEPVMHKFEQATFYVQRRQDDKCVLFAKSTDKYVFVWCPQINCWI